MPSTLSAEVEKFIILRLRFTALQIVIFYLGYTIFCQSWEYIRCHICKQVLRMLLQQFRIYWLHHRMSRQCQLEKLIKTLVKLKVKLHILSNSVVQLCLILFYTMDK
jgi:hypothetical protein